MIEKVILNFLKQYGVMLIIIASLGYCVNSSITSNQEENKKEQIRKEKEDRVEANISNIVKQSNANYQWIKQIEKNRIKSLLTIELEKLWVGERPIFFTGRILDISSVDETKYLVKIEKSMPFISLPEIELHLTCSKDMVDKFLSESNYLSDEFILLKGVVVIARIERFGLSDHGNIGFGTCSYLMRDVAYRTNFESLIPLFEKNK